MYLGYRPRHETWCSVCRKKLQIVGEFGRLAQSWLDREHNVAGNISYPCHCMRVISLALAHWHTGTLAHWHTGTLAHWHTGTLANRYDGGKQERMGVRFKKQTCFTDVAYFWRHVRRDWSPTVSEEKRNRAETVGQRCIQRPIPAVPLSVCSPKYIQMVEMLKGEKSSRDFFLMFDGGDDVYSTRWSALSTTLAPPVHFLLCSTAHIVPVKYFCGSNVTAMIHCKTE
jgi:hypothetical protein